MREHTSRPGTLAGLFLALLGGVCAQQGHGADAAAKPLFTQNGPVTSGWTTRHWVDVSKPPTKDVKWEVKDGVLWGTGQFSPGNSGDQWVGTWLLSEAEYGNFILELEFRFKNGGRYGNGGIALRAPLKGDPAYEGLELQITDPQFEFSYFPLASSAQLTGALYLVSRPITLAYREGDWNRYRIELRGSKVKVTLNDQLVQDVDLDTLTKPALKHAEGQELVHATPGAQRPRRGHIGLQDLSENGEVLLFRNVRLTALD